MTCETCKHGDRAVNAHTGEVFYWCRAMPPRPVAGPEMIQWVVPMMIPAAWCGCYGFSLRKWLRRLFKGHGA